VADNDRASPAGPRQATRLYRATAGRARLKQTYGRDPTSECAGRAAFKKFHPMVRQLAVEPDALPTECQRRAILPRPRLKFLSCGKMFSATQYPRPQAQRRVNDRERPQ
jgi:hypothetical protein